MPVYITGPSKVLAANNALIGQTHAGQVKPMELEDIRLFQDKAFWEAHNRLIAENRVRRIEQVQQGKVPLDYYIPVLGAVVEATDQASQGKYGKAALSGVLGVSEVVGAGLVGKGVRLVGPLVKRGVQAVVGKGVGQVVG